jgi:DNA-binding MarR family transcriptional regulator
LSLTTIVERNHPEVSAMPWPASSEQSMGVTGRRQVARRAVAAKAPEDTAPALGAPVKPSGRPARKAISLGSLEDRVGYFVRRLQVWIFQDFIRTLKSVQVRPAQYSVLVLIGANPALSQSDLADALGIERARLVRLLDGLERRGWTVRLPATADRRSHALFLTAEGERMLRRVEALVAQHEAHVTARLGAGRREKVMKLLRDFG